MQFKEVVFGVSIMLCLDSCGHIVYAKNKPRSESILTWDAEPDSFLGLKFGQTLESQIPECQNEYDILNSSKSCWKSFGQGLRPINNPPTLGVLYEAYGHVVNGTLEGMTIEFDHYNYLKMLDMFREKYGLPTLEKKSLFQATGGVKVQGNVYHWVGKNIEIIFSEYGGTIDKGEINVFTKDFKIGRSEENRRNTNTYKDNL